MRRALGTGRKPNRKRPLWSPKGAVDTLRYSLLGPITFVILTAACSTPSTAPKTSDPRIVHLEKAFAVRRSDPAAAATHFAAAGPGATLEEARQIAWFRVLETGAAGSEGWRGFVAAETRPDLAARATVRLAETVAAEGDLDEAVAILLGAPDSVRVSADLALLDLGDAPAASEAAARLARCAPQLLRKHSERLERVVLAGFDSADWIERAAAWRAAGLGSRGAAELRRRRDSGEEERARRKELARCELDGGSSTRALNALPSRRDADHEELMLRAEAYRLQGWGRSPDRSAARSFATCLDEAELALDGGDGDVRDRALVLVLECATEAGRLDRALDAWRRLEASSWDHPRRSWLGRRLGVAMARSATDPEIVTGMASALADQERCLEYWRSSEASDDGALAELASAPIADLYGRWAARGRTDGTGFALPPPAGAAVPPPAVAWLLANAGPAEASAEWQRIIGQRRPTRPEALAACQQASRAGLANTAIRSLRAAYPGISSVALARVPGDAATAYLPLAHADQLIAAARATGLDPWLIAAVARQESTFVSDARSPAGAVGVLQVLPSTARLHARALGFGGRPDLTDPAVNIHIGARELAALVRRYGAVEPALAAYNAGERRVRRWWRAWPEPRVFTESIPIPETYTYVRRVVFLADAYRQVHADAWKEAP